MLKYIRYIWMLCMLLCFPMSSYAGELSLDIEYGFEGFAKMGRYLPITIQYDNHGESFVGSLKIDLNKDGGQSYEYIFDIRIDETGKLEREYYVPLSEGSETIWTEVRDEQGKVLWSQPFSLNTSKDITNLMIGILSDTNEHLSYFDNINLRYGLIKTKVVALDTKSFPSDIRGLDQLDMLLISNYRIRDLSLEQSRTLMDWVEAGGILLLGTGLRVDDTLGRFAPELLDEMYEEPKFMEVSIQKTSVGTPSEEVLTLAMVDFKLHGGNVIMADSDTSLLSMVARGRGNIVVAGYDFIDIKDYAKAHESFLPELFDNIIDSERLYDLVAQNYGLAGKSDTAMYNVIGGGDSLKLPPLPILVLLYLSYILLTGIALYTFLKYREVLRYYRMGVWMSASLFSIVIYFLAVNTRYSGILYKYARIYEFGEDSKAKHIYINIRNFDDASYALTLPQQYMIQPVNLLNEQKPSGSILIGEGERNYLEFRNTPPSTSHFFTMDLYEENELGVGITGDINIYKNKLNGTVVNRLDTAVENIILVSYGKLALLGNFEAGEERTFSDLEVYNIPLLNTDAMVERLPFLDEEKKKLLSFYLQYTLSGYTSDAKWIVFTPNEEEIFMEKNIEAQGLDLYTFNQTVDNTKEEYVYRLALAQSPKVLSGEYYYSSNSIYSLGPTVLEYYLGEDIEIKEILFERISEEYRDEQNVEFTGNIYIYNYILGEYQFIGNNIEKIEDAGAYISNQNTITIRYSADADKGEDQIIPLLSVIGIIN